MLLQVLNEFVLCDPVVRTGINHSKCDSSLAITNLMQPQIMAAECAVQSSDVGMGDAKSEQNSITCWVLLSLPATDCCCCQSGQSGAGGYCIAAN